MRSLTEAFAPGAPSLPEGLRTLVVSPDRIVEPGATLRATFAFYNLGGAAATGLRVRFSLPDGVRYLAGSARIDDQPLEEVRGETALLAAAGADIGEVPPGVERRISIGYLVNAMIDNGATIDLQAALLSHETGVIGSNVVTLFAKSTPILQNPATIVAIEAIRTPEPGEEVRVTARVHNSGQSAARDIVVVLPVPDRTTFVTGSARIDGRDFSPDDDGDDPFGFGRAPVIMPALPAGATLVLEYRARIDSPLENDTRLFAAGAVASAEVAEFELARAELTVRSESRFDGGATALLVDAPADVEPGRRVRISLTAQNIGTCAASDVRLRLVLPDGLQYASGSRAIDGRAVGENGEAGAFHFDRIEAGAKIEAAVDAYVVSPAVDGTQLPIAASLQWSTGSRTFDRTLTVRSKPRFLESRNKIALDGSATVTPGAEVRVVARIVNDGTTSAANARLTIDADETLQSLRYIIGDDRDARVQGGVISLGTLEANAEIEVVLFGTVASPIGDRTEIRLAASLIANETPPLALGTIVLVARSRARFAPATSTLAYAGDGPMRPSGAGLATIVLVNEGTDVARDVRLVLDLSPEARIEGVDGATRDGHAIIFGDIPAGGRHEAMLRLRLARFVGRGATVALHARLTGASLLPVALEPLTIETLAEPNFSDGAGVRTQPQDSVDAGEAIYVQIIARNTGDGSAARLIVRAALPQHTAYLPGSTTINDVPLLDADGGSVLWSKAGLVLEDVDPGVEISVRYGAIVNTPLAAGTLIETAADLAWDGGRVQSLAAAAVRVRSTPAFAVRASGLPFSVAGVAPRTADVLRDIRPPARALPPSPSPSPTPASALPPPPVTERLERAAPPASAAPPPSAAPHPEPAAVVIASPPPPAAAPPPQQAAPPPPPPPEPVEPPLRVQVGFSRESLERAMALLEQSDYGGLVRHLFALRMLFPERIAGLNGELEAKFTAERDALRGVVDRLFIKMRLPRYALTAKDLEDRTSRMALVELVAALRLAKPGDGIAPLREPILVEGTIDRDRIVANLSALESEPLGGPRPWLVIAELLGERISWPGGGVSEALGVYRSALVATFLNVGALPIDEFHRVLTGSSNASLDAGLGDVRAALRDAIEATATDPLSGAVGERV
jgi:uncharacterized repeat protein (TIGR01451 family)